MYLLPNQAMELLQITTRQGLHKVASNHNITIKSQGAGKPNLYLKQDLERYRSEILKTGKDKYNKEVTQKAIKIKKEKVERKEKAKKLKEETKKELNLVGEYKPVDNLSDDEDIIKPPYNPNEFQMKDLLNEIGQDEFDRVVELLKENGTYKEQDRALVLTYAVSFQNWVFATVASAREDNTTTDHFGTLRLHPYFQVAKEAFNQMEKSSKLLGIGVRSRIGLELKSPKKETIFDILNSKESFE